MIPERSRAVGPFVAVVMFLAALVLFVFVLVPRVVSADPPPVSPSPSPPPDDCAARASSVLPARLMVDAAQRVSTGRIDAVTGIAVLDRCDGEIALGDRGVAVMRSASLAKLVTAVDVLTRRDHDEIELTAADVELLRRALGPSDDDAMNDLWTRFDGPGGVVRVARLVGLRETVPPADESRWGDTGTSARDVAALYGYILDRLEPADRDLVLGDLAAAPRIAADGFDQGFGLLEPARRGSAQAKQGWACRRGGALDLHSAGLLEAGGRYVLAVLSTQPPDERSARASLDAAAAAARDVGTGPAPADTRTRNRDELVGSWAGPGPAT
ncbi:hypothetical protein [Actinomycetospora flava]|uniref:Beta-lactamase class A n=1 Tax=Actinomycetospora flava TaxID=3129232 RepID=A0ABU8MDM4_9PSEU